MTKHCKIFFIEKVKLYIYQFLLPQTLPQREMRKLENPDALSGSGAGCKIRTRDLLITTQCLCKKKQMKMF